MNDRQYDFAFGPELIIDNFAGGGGASLGIEWAFGRPVDHAINHDHLALAMHAANHPRTIHHESDVWDIDPRKLCKGPIGLAWFSPDCKHFSKAKGGRPVSKRIRGLAWVAARWARAVHPRVIVLENVEEFEQWGPLIQIGKDKWMPDPDRKGLTFKRFVGQLRGAGYKVEWRQLRASDYGVPTIRKRFFLIARCDGKPIVWPEPTHGKGRAKPPGAHTIIDWSIPCPSIFTRKRPLAEATQRRIARGIMRYVVECADPFIVPVTHGGDDRVHDIHDPLRTIVAGNGGEFAIVTPTLVNTAHGEGAGKTKRRGSGTASVEQPLGTVTASGGDVALVAPCLVPRYGEREGQEPRSRSVQDPLATVVTTDNGAALVAAFLAQHNSEKVGERPKAGRAARDPLSTIVGTGGQQQVVAAYLAQHNGGENGHQTTGHDARQPVSTINAKGSQQQLVTAILSHAYTSNTAGGQGDPREPMKTIVAGGWHASLVKAFLVKYYGDGGQWQSLKEPLHTVRTKDCIGLVTVKGVEYQIVDIGMRMLTPRELARAQGFPDSYVLNPIVDGKPLTKTDQVRMIGNSVCPPLARAIVEANVGKAKRAKPRRRAA